MGDLGALDLAPLGRGACFRLGRRGRGDRRIQRGRKEMTELPGLNSSSILQYWFSPTDSDLNIELSIEIEIEVELEAIETVQLDDLMTRFPDGKTILFRLLAESIGRLSVPKLVELRSKLRTCDDQSFSNVLMSVVSENVA
ncbi:hypothetical protein BGX29_007175 [Mortierella sp. GBA35]|nr:hypothetical protein BGX29_007175 [Mortierella sp. GBA35]